MLKMQSQWRVNTGWLIAKVGRNVKLETALGKEKREGSVSERKEGRQSSTAEEK